MILNLQNTTKAIWLILKTKLKSYLFIIVSLLFLYSIFSVFANIFSYFDPINFCYIGIDNDLIRGNQNTIKGAIIQLKNSDKESYRVLCKYIDTVMESYCFSLSTDEKSVTVPTDNSGCYLKGSKILFLFPSKDTGYYIVQQRAATIKKYADYSKTFWESRK